MKRLALLACVAAGPACGAGAIDSLDCRDALARLQAFEDQALAAASRPAAVPLANLRQRAAKACLGSLKDEPVPAGRMAPPPMVVPPVTLRLPPAPPAAARPAAPATAPAGPQVITSCDLTGCWANDGTRLNRSGPLLVGPRGPCSTNGSFLVCP